MLGKVEKERDQGNPMENMKSMRTEMIKCFYNCEFCARQCVVVRVIETFVGAEWGSFLVIMS